MIRTKDICNFTVLSLCGPYIRQSDCSLFRCCQNQEISIKSKTIFDFLPLKRVLNEIHLTFCKHIYGKFETLRRTMQFSEYTDKKYFCRAVRNKFCFTAKKLLLRGKKSFLPRFLAAWQKNILPHGKE